ncbi:MAG: hypothetical protein SPI77_07220 [Corynebacterium sp.]|nr:hypothetical protein [Corynebacterium sp.]
MLATEIRQWVELDPDLPAAQRRYLCGLLDASGPLRVAVTSLVGPIPVELPGVRVVSAAWPLTTDQIDVGIVVTPTVSTRVRSRIASADFPIFTCPTVDAVAQVVAGLSERAVREETVYRALRRYPDAPHRPVGPAPTDPQVAVVGRDPERVAAVVELLSVDGLAVAAGPNPQADVCVAVAGSAGWRPGDVEVLTDALQAIGRVVVTAPVPGGVDGAIRVTPALTSEALVATVREVLAGPPVFPLPELTVGSLNHMAKQVEARDRQRKFQVIEQSGVGGEALRSVLGVEAEQAGRYLSLLDVAQIALVAVVAGVGVSRVGPVWMAVVVACALGLVRLVGIRRTAAEHQLKTAVSGSSSSAAGAWLRQLDVS